MTTDMRPLLFLDVDGTLLPAGGALKPATLDDWYAIWQNPSNPQLAKIDHAHGPRLLALPAHSPGSTTNSRRRTGGGSPSTTRAQLCYIASIRRPV